MNLDRLVLLLASPLIVAAGVARAACRQLPLAVLEVREAWDYFGPKVGARSWGQSQVFGPKICPRVSSRSANEGTVPVK